MGYHRRSFFVVAGAGPTGSHTAAWSAGRAAARRHAIQRRRVVVQTKAQVERPDGPKGAVSSPGMLRAVVVAGGRH